MKFDQWQPITLFKKFNDNIFLEVFYARKKDQWESIVYEKDINGIIDGVDGFKYSSEIVGHSTSEKIARTLCEEKAFDLSKDLWS